MKVAVFGAAGGTGRFILLQALARGHEVTAIVRDAARLHFSYPNLKVIEADAFRPETYAFALRGQDAVISALGVSGFRNSLKPMTFHVDTARLILGAMSEAGVGRYLGMSSVGVLKEPDTPFWYRLLVKPLLRHKYADMRMMEELVREAPLAWTLVRPVQLVDGAFTRSYRVNLSGEMPRGAKVSRADVASCIVQLIADESAERKSVAVSY